MMKNPGCGTYRILSPQMNDREEAKNNFFDQVQILRDFMGQIGNRGYIFSLKEELLTYLTFMTYMTLLLTEIECFCRLIAELYLIDLICFVIV